MLVLMQITIFMYYRDDHGSFINDTILRVRTCYIDEIAWAFNVLTNHGPVLTAGRHNRNKIVTFYNSKNLKIKCILWNIVLLISISISKSFYSIYSSLWSLRVLTRTSPQSIVEIKCDLACLFIYFFKTSFLPNPMMFLL